MSSQFVIFCLNCIGHTNSLVIGKSKKTVAVAGFIKFHMRNTENSTHILFIKFRIYFNYKVSPCINFTGIILKNIKATIFSKYFISGFF